MTEDTCPRVSSSDSDSSKTKQRKRRKWDQPDEALVSAGLAVPGVFPLAKMGSLPRITLPSVPVVSGAPVTTPFTASVASLPQVVQLPLQQHAASIIQKLIQPKIQDEIIAREIVINDADSAIRYKLTKRQTQEEIQKCTGAVVITRGKYRPPNAPPDGERPLYLHISAASHLETTAERIKAVDHAAALVEEMLKQASINKGVKVDHLLSACVFLGFEADPSWNIASRIRGPNDQYVNHIMNETGATVLLRGRGSGNEGSEEAQQPLHLLLSSNDIKSLEHAKLLAENLLDTIGAECGASRVSSSKAYGAVPPPPELQSGVVSPGNTSEPKNIASSSMTSLAGLTNAAQYPMHLSIGVSNPGPPLANTASYPHVSLTNATSYLGYGGIYPQATPLQQVALALRQSTSPVTATVAPSTTAASKEPPSEAVTSKDKRPQKRKFQELPSCGKNPANINQKNLQGSEFPMPRELTSHVGARDTSVVPGSKKIVPPSYSAMPPPPSRIASPPSPPPKFPSCTNGMPPPPPLPRTIRPLSPPPKFSSSSNGMPPHPPTTVLAPSAPPKFSSTVKLQGDDHAPNKPKTEVPDTLVKLMEYGDDDDEDPEETGKQLFVNHSSLPAAPKPFWDA